MRPILAPQQRREPSGDTLVIDPDLVAPERRDLIPRFADPCWSLEALDQYPSATAPRIYWRGFPAATGEQFRQAAWALINFPVPDDLLLRSSAAMRTKLSPQRMKATIGQWRAFSRWLEERSITSLHQVRVDDLNDYAHALTNRQRRAPNTVVSHLIALSRLYGFAQVHLEPSCRIPEPPWRRRGFDDYLPAGARTNGENATAPLAPGTIGPLLAWALRFVEDFAPDILAARAERHRLLDQITPTSISGRRVAVERFFQDLKATGRPIPSNGRCSGPPQVAVTFIAAQTAASIQQADCIARLPEWRRYFEQHHGPCLLTTPVTGRLHGRAWTDAIEFGEVDALHRHLGTACFIVIAYLTGMRPAEVLALESGCCPDPVAGDATEPRRYSITGRHFKDARDNEGNHLGSGLPRTAPWTTIRPAATAIRVLERFAPSGLLFATSVHDGHRSHRLGRSLTAGALNSRITDFTNWVNATADRLGCATEIIPTDPQGPVTTARFRRTLAWHIARQPDGLVALAVQYGHLRTVVSEGYASRSRDGIADLLDFETARAVADHLADLGDDLAHGAGVSGPAARRLIQATERHAERFGGSLTTKRQHRALLADPLLTVFENKTAYLTCNYDPSKALCHPDRAVKNSTPSLDRCQAGCANIARTDQHAAGLRAEANRLTQESENPLTPRPIADRLSARARHLRSLADRHDTDRITIDQEQHQ